MERKTKKTQPEAINASAIARRAECSRQLVARLLARGFDERQIVARIAERKAREAERTARNSGATANGNGAAPVSSLPPMPWPAFSISEARKEHILAELREVQLLKERGQLIPLTYVKAWASTFLTEGRSILLQGPGELQDALAQESDPVRVSAILRRWVETAMEKFHRTGKLWGEEPKGDAA
jgi:hypothetical protein